MVDVTIYSENMYENKKVFNIGLITKTLSIYFWITICFLYALPTSVTNLIKPAFIYVILLEIIILKKKLSFKAEQFITLLASLYFLLIFILNGLNYSNLKGFAPIFLNLTVLGLISSIKYNQIEVKKLINVLFYSGFVFSLIIAISNPFINSNISRLQVRYLNNTLNANGVCYVIVPSAVIAIYKLLNKKDKFVNKLIILATLTIMLYSLFYTNSRGGAVALLSSTFLLIYKYVQQRSKRKIKNIFFICTIVTISILLIFTVLPDFIVNRIFSFSSYNLNSRDVLWSTAIQLSRDSIYFGHGFDYWTKMTGNSYGSHNLYLDLLVSSGLFGALFLIVLVIMILFKSKKNLFILSLMTAPLLNTLLESGMTYSFWNPLILCVITYSCITK